MLGGEGVFDRMYRINKMVFTELETNMVNFLFAIL